MGPIRKISPPMSLNCHVKDLSRIWECLLQDTTIFFPALRDDLQRDLSRLRSSIVSRGGLTVFLQDLPNIGKHLDRCLADGHFKRSGLPLSGAISRRVATPKFLRGIHQMVFYDDGRLREDADPLAIFFYRQLTLFAKKYKVDCPPRAIADAVREFVTDDLERPEPSRFWRSKDPWDATRRPSFAALSTSPSDRSLLSILDIVSRIISNSLGVFDPADWRCKHGPGAVSERAGKHDKYRWLNWPSALETVFPFADYGFHSYSSWADYVCHNDVDGGQPSSRLVAVPKSYDGPRLIAAEPAAGMWCQQSMLAYFSCRFSRTFIGEFIQLSDQARNRDFALTGSRTDRIATIDLSSASDTVTCQIVESMFGYNKSLMEALRSIRTPTVSQQLTDKVSETHELRMFSTMGNAVTFPVESLVFLAVALTATCYTDGINPTVKTLRSLSAETSVYGDDIVIPNRSRDAMCRLLELLRFRCNTRKTFWEGNFRESCGCDAFKGHDVTPIYWRQQFTGTAVSLSSCVSVRNAFYRKYLLYTSAAIESTLPSGIPEVAYDSGVFGYVVRRLPITPVRVRWNPDLQRNEAKVLSVQAKPTLVRTQGHSALLQYFTEKPRPHFRWKAGYVRDSNEVIRWRWLDLGDLGCSALVPTSLV